MVNSTLDKAVQSVVFMTGAMVAGLGVSALARLVLASQLEPSVFGNFTVVVAIAGLVALPVNTLGDRLIVVTSYDRSLAVNTVFTVELLVWFTLSAACIAASGAFWGQLSGGMHWSLGLLLLLQGLAFPLSRPRALLERDLEFKAISIVNIGTQILVVVVAVTLSFWVKTELPLVLCALVAVLQGCVFFWMKKTPLKLEIDPAIFGEYCRLCLPLMASAALIYVTWNGDRILLDGFVSRESIGHYGWAFSIGAIILRLKDGLTSVFLPVFSSLVRENRTEELKQGLTLMYRAVGAFYGLAIPPIVFLCPILILAVGPAWQSATTCLQIAIMIFTLRTLSSFLEPILVAYGRSHILLYFTVSNAAVIVVGGYAAMNIIPSIEAMAFVVLLSTIGTVAACSYVVRSLTGVSVARVVAPSAAFGTLSSALVWGAKSVWGNDLIVVGLAVLVGSTIYVAGMWEAVGDLVARLRRRFCYA